MKGTWAMILPLRSLSGTIERRLLINFRVQPDVLARCLPPPFRPQLVHGWGMAGICLIRLAQLRPVGLPSVCGMSSENAAHRVAVTWPAADGVHRGVYIPRRDTDSPLARMLGGVLFPGEYRRARFQVHETEAQLRLTMSSLDGRAAVALECRPAERLHPGSVFASLDQASRFFREGCLGFSKGGQSDRYDALQLIARKWRVEPLDVTHVESGFFNNRRLFPFGSVEFDSALIMRSLPCRWQARPALEISRQCHEATQ